MTNQKIELRFQKLEKALKSLENIAFKPVDKDRANVDATIQRFEFTIELFWNLLKAILEEKGVKTQYPKDVMREAFKGGLINDEAVWIKALEDRNSTSHTYDEELADAIYGRIHGYIPIFRKSFDGMNKNKF